MIQEADEQPAEGEGEHPKDECKKGEKDEVSGKEDSEGPTEPWRSDRPCSSNAHAETSPESPGSGLLSPFYEEDEQSYGEKEEEDSAENPVDRCIGQSRVQSD